MKRIMIVATLVVFAQISAGFSMPAPQTFPGATKLNLRRINVNAKTITALTPDKNYIVDLTQRGVVYEFSHQTGQIDLSRVRVRTANGEVPIGSYLETTFLKGKLTGFKYKSQAFSLAITQPGTLQNPSKGARRFNCEPEVCTCIGFEDCLNMIVNERVCTGKIFCANNPITGEEHCACIS
jgi:hypothetical protein